MILGHLIQDMYISTLILLNFIEKGKLNK